MSFVEKLRAIVGDKGLVLDAQEMRPYLTDWRENYLGAALAIVRPATTDEVSEVVRLCAAEKVAICPQGGNTGMSGGATPQEVGLEIVLSLTRMNRILDIDKVGYSMTVEAGVILKTIQETAADHDRLFPLSLGAEGSCTIGGNLSTNAGGVQVLHYGNARNLVMGLEVVLPNGDIWNGMRALKKDNTGYDLRDLYLGAEGTLGIITKAILKLWPKPKDVATAWTAVASPAAAVELLSGAYAASEDNVTSCELMGRQGIELVLKNIHGATDPLADKHDWYVLLEWSSSRPPRHGANQTGLREKMEAYLGEAMEKGLVLDAVIAQNEAQARSLLGPARKPLRVPEARRSVDQARHLGVGQQAAGVRDRRPRRHEQGAAGLPSRPVRPCRRRQPPFQLPVAAGLEQAAVHALRRSDQRCDLRSRDELRRLDLGRARHRPHQGRRARALSQPDRARRHAHAQARPRPAQHHEPRQGHPALGAGGAEDHRPSCVRLGYGRRSSSRRSTIS